MQVHKPWFGVFYCLSLTFYSRVKQLKEEPYTQKEAEAAIGLRTDNGGASQTTKAGNGEVVMST